jgi:hypothetical protein
MSKKLIVSENPLLEKDEYSKAIINTDNLGYRAAIARRESIKRKNNEILEIKKQIEELLLWQKQIIEKLNENNLINNSNGSR